ncbi:LysE family translocator [Litchfieldia salsa]|uniref:Threonine/homoserine/homoserine lactone efflux protein n=1 Tax=Litchfieldia salsa TaxID=930152 RepID=A0A1H0QB21_9BACI|nr:LysE family translocator [Litchfieldia salsa]SDP14265.1 Threonine/homoserine/homoserine lactone efflux protein [Litchfieldia salsa]
MYGIINFEVFLIASLLLNLTPGTDTMYIVSRSISQGRLAGIYSTLGISAGIITHTLLAAFGLSVILMQSTVLFTLIKMIGAVYLAYLGIKMLLEKQSEKSQVSLSQQSHIKIFVQGMITNVTNPKVALFFLAFLPQFIQSDSSVTSPIPFILLGLSFTITAGIWSLFTVYFSSMATNKLKGNSKISNLLNRLTGIVFIAMGLKLLSTKATA